MSSYEIAATRSELEEAFLTLCDVHGLPRPETNPRIAGFEVDFVWRDARLIVEVDGYAYHRSPSAFERDRERDAILTTNGWRVLRFTHAPDQRPTRMGRGDRAQGSNAAGYLTSPGANSPRTIHAGSSMPHWFVMPSDQRQALTHQRCADTRALMRRQHRRGLLDAADGVAILRPLRADDHPRDSAGASPGATSW